MEPEWRWSFWLFSLSVLAYITTLPAHSPPSGPPPSPFFVTLQRMEPEWRWSFWLFSLSVLAYITTIAVAAWLRFRQFDGGTGAATAATMSAALAFGLWGQVGGGRGEVLGGLNRTIFGPQKWIYFELS